MLEVILDKGGYWLIIALMMTGLYIVFAATNFIKRMVGLSVFQTSVFLFYITLSKVAGGTAPILYGKDYPKTYGDDGQSGPAGGVAPVLDPSQGPGEQGPASSDPSAGDVEPAALETANDAVPIAGADVYPAYSGVEEVYSNPLPHVLILTAIVVGVATLSVGLAIIVRIREAYGTIEADEVREMDIIVATAEEMEDADGDGMPGPRTDGGQTEAGAPA
ncbi:MAG: cation:proton antiporter subunit C [Pseudomonadota bacterium]